MKVEELENLKKSLDFVRRQRHTPGKDYFQPYFDKETAFEIILRFEHMEIYIKDVPKEIAKSLFDSHFINTQIKLLEAKQALLAAGIELEENENGIK